MLTQLPKQIEPIRLAATGQVISGKIALSGMHRLTTLLSDAKQEAVVELKFGIDDTGQAIVKGHIDTKFKLICQRCMESMSYPVNAIVNLGLVQSYTESEQLPGNYEPFIVEEPQISLSDLIEDELLLALPAAAMHPIDECDNSKNYQFSDDSSRRNVRTRAANISTKHQKYNMDSNPFALLANLKIKSKQ